MHMTKLQFKWSRNAVWQPNLVDEPLNKVKCNFWSQRSYKGSSEVNQGSNCSGMPYGYQILSDEPHDRSLVQCWVEGHVGPDGGQPEVK